MLARTIDPAFAAACRRCLREFALSCPNLKAASISTKDGVVIASYGASEANSKIAVIAGTLHAVSEAVVVEADLQDCRNIVIEAAGGRVALLSLPGALSDFVLSAIVETQTSLGMLLGCCRVCCESIAFESETGSTYSNGSARNGA